MNGLAQLGSAALRVLPFELVVRAQLRLVRIEAVRRRLFPRELELTDRFLGELGVRDPVEVERARRERALATWIHHVRRHFMALPASRQAAWLKLDADIEATLRQGALLVGSHFGCGSLTPVALSLFGIELVTIVRSTRIAGPAYSLRFTRTLDLSTESPVRVAGEARWTLRRGGVVFVAGDLVTGRPDGDIEVALLGRRRRLPRGFAELSIASSIPPTPVFSRVDQAGNIFTWVEPPLTTDDAGDREARVAALTQAYADRLAANFAAHPGNVAPPAIETLLASPLARKSA